MKVGDLVKHMNANSLGLGLVTEIDEPSYSAGVTVLWPTRQKPTREVRVCLKVINESR